MPKDDAVYFGHMLEMARKAYARASQLDKTQFDANEEAQLALAHLVQIIREAASRVSQPGQDAHPEVPWREITGMRNKIVHDYMGVDFDVVWQVVTEDLQPLISALERVVPNDT